MEQTQEVNYGEFYGNVMGNVNDLVHQAISQSREGDLIQLELRGQMLRSRASVIASASEALDLTQFQDLLDRTIQSNFSVLTDASLELVVQIVRSPTGSGRRQLQKTLACEIFKKKQRFLYIVENKDNQLCFAISLAHLMSPEITDAEALSRARELQREAGLTEQTSVCFTDMSKFEEVTQRKIVVFYRTDKEHLNIFQTSNAPKDQPLYLFLFDNHYYGVKNAKAFLGVRYLCNYCHKG